MPYRETVNFPRPGWRLTIPGGPAGGQIKGWTHNYSAGTSVGSGVQPADQFEIDRGEGLASHDTVHVHPNAPRGVYRGPAEVPPRPNASGSAHTYRDFQTERHAGTSISPGSFPAPFDYTGDDVLAVMVSGQMRHAAPLGAIAPIDMIRAPGGSSVYTATPLPAAAAPNIVRIGPAIRACSEMVQMIPPGCIAETTYDSNGCPIRTPVCPPISGPLDYGPWYMGPTGPAPTVPQPSTPPAVDQTQAPAPAPSVPVPTPPGGVMPPLAPAPSVATGIVTRDASGNFVDSFGNIYSPSEVTLNPSTNQYQLLPGATPSTMASVQNWLTSNSIYSAWPNWYFLAGGVGLMLFLRMRGGRRR